MPSYSHTRLGTISEVRRTFETIHTPPARVVRAAIKKRKDAIAKRRAANKKKV